MSAVHWLSVCVLVLLVACAGRESGTGSSDASDNDGTTGSPDASVVSCGDGLAACGATCVDTTSNGAHCGRCNAPCGGGTFCREGTCQSDCGEVLKTCGQSCVDTDISPEHCGTCDRSCISGDNAVRACVGGTCNQECQPGYYDCNDTTVDGCEVDGATDIRHCGGCGRACPEPHESMEASCVDSICVNTCMAGTGDCNESESDGCEVDTLTRDDHCGMCGMQCTGNTTCSNGTCAACPDVPINPYSGTVCASETYDCMVGCGSTNTTCLNDCIVNDPNRDDCLDCLNVETIRCAIGEGCGGENNCFAGCIRKYQCSRPDCTECRSRAGAFQACINSTLSTCYVPSACFPS